MLTKDNYINAFHFVENYIFVSMKTNQKLRNPCFNHRDDKNAFVLDGIIFDYTDEKIINKRCFKKHHIY